MNYILLIIVGAVGVAFGMWFSRKTSKRLAPKQAEEMKEMQAEAREAVIERTEKRKERILDLMKGEAVHQKELQACGVVDIKAGITSRNVEKLFDVSGGTARKYLNELESEEKIKQIGTSGPGVYYVLSA